MSRELEPGSFSERMGGGGPPYASRGEPHLVRTLRGHRGGVSSVCFSKGKKEIASGGMDSCVMLWQFGGDEKKKRATRAFRLVGHRGPVHRVTFSPDGSEIASASSDKCVRLWQPSARGGSIEIKAHSAPIRSVDYSPDGSRLMTASDDKSIKVWSLPSKKFSCSLGGSDELSEFGGRRTIATANAHAHWVRCARWAPDGRVAASCGDDKVVKLWDVEARRSVRTFFDHENVVRDVNFSYDGTCLVSAGDDRKINVWDSRTYALLQHYAAHDAPVTSISIDASGRYLASTSQDATMKLYDLRQGQLLYTLKGHKGAVGCSAFDHRHTSSQHDGEQQQQQLFASGGADRVLMIWKAKLDGCCTNNNNTPQQDVTTPQPQDDDEEPPKRRVDVFTDDFVEEATKTVKEMKKKTTSMSRSFPNLEQVARRGSGEELPESVAATLDHIVGQLSVVTSTLGMLEQRLTITENRIAALTFGDPSHLDKPQQQDLPLPPEPATTMPE